MLIDRWLYKETLFKITFIRDARRWYFYNAKLLQKSEMRKDIVIELSYKGFS